MDDPKKATPKKAPKTKENSKEEFKKLKKAEVLALSDEERDKYFVAMFQQMKEEKKAIEKAAAQRELVAKQRNRPKLNHAKYIIVAEFLKSPIARSFLETMAKNNAYEKRTREALNLLMKELKFDICFNEMLL